jgi:hypothetical protein
VFDRDTVFLNFKALKLGTVLDTIKIYHKALSTSSPIIIPVKISVTITGVEQEKPLQYNYKLYQNSPNPFSAGGRSASGGNPSTLIKFTIAKYEHVSLRVYDILGRNVETLIDSDMEKGEHELNWKPKASVSSGIYLVNISTGSFYDTKKIVYQK